MLSPSMAEKLSSQITLELFSSNLYLQMSAWCTDKGLEGCAGFMRAHAEEEREHMQRLFDYIHETGAVATISAIEAPRSDYADVAELFSHALSHEQQVTEAVNALVAHAFEERDFATFNFLQWYVTEQHEEENAFKTIVDKATLIGMEGRGAYLFDTEVAKLADDAPAALEA